MPQPQTFLRCSRRSAVLILATIFLLFLAIGCAAMLRKTGLDQPEADQIAADAQSAMAAAAADAVDNIKTGIAQGKPLPAIATETASVFGWKLAAIAASTIGAVLSALLAKWLGTERKMTAALITGIEKTNNITTKEYIQKKAIAAGVQDQLDRRVQALT